MNKVQGRGVIKYDDLMRELEGFEQQLLGENQGLAMEMMVLEAKIRERFQKMENYIWDRYATLDFDRDETDEDELSLADIEAMIPRDISIFPSENKFLDGRRRKRTIQTVGLAAVLAVLAAVSVFGLASVLQVAISWLA